MIEMKKIAKCIIAFLMAVITLTLAVAPVGATWTYPDGGTLTANLVNEDKLNKTIYVYHRDLSGKLLKYCEYKTKIMDYDTFGDSLYGYDIVAYSSNEGIGEHCKMTWACGNGKTAGYGQIGYQFYWISKSSLTINFTYDIQEATTFRIEHILLDENNSRSLYASGTESHLYGSSYYITKRTITGYELVEEYLPILNGTFTYDVIVSNKNFGNLSYVFHHGSKNGEMYDWNSYEKSDKDYIDYCDNRELLVRFMYKLKSYTVSFNANGGYGSPEPITKYYGKNAIIPDAVPIRSGYTFKGWGTYSTDTSANYQPGGEYTSNYGRTLYAIWQSNEPETYTVSYNANGGFGAPASQAKTKNETLTLSSVEPTRSGYTFLGWSESSYATSAEYSAGGLYTKNADSTLYAVWKQNEPEKTYTVVYYANGGSAAPVSQIKTHNVPLTLSSDIPTREGYVFCGWGTGGVYDTTAEYQPSGLYNINDNIILYAIWEKKPSDTYEIIFDANGGSEAPDSLTKTNGIALTLPSTIPIRTHYTFLGWSESSSATIAEYTAGGLYTKNADSTLYAVWQKDNYEFSLSSLTISESEVSKYGIVTVEIQTDSWDSVNSYTGIPVELLYDESVIATKDVSFAKYGVANLTFDVNVGGVTGTHTLTARINWNDRTNESDPNNNEMSTSIAVKDYECDFSVNTVPNNMISDDFCEGITVISSFTVDNNGNRDIIPEDNLSVLFTAYYYNGTNKVEITSETHQSVVIPKDGTNLVYFKFRVPDDTAGKTVYCECTVNSDSKLNEPDRSNNTITVTKVIKSIAESQTENPPYEAIKPSTYGQVSTPSEKSDSKTWNMWAYENGVFVLKNYGVKTSAVSPVITASDGCKTSFFDNGFLTMKSGYAIKLTWTPILTSLDGYLMPETDAYTDVQSALALFPEYRYLSSAGKFRTLEYTAGSYSFVKNAGADGNERVHFIPVWFDDGNYTVSISAGQIWTPAGAMSIKTNANTIKISGTIYDDWYH